MNRRANQNLLPHNKLVCHIIALKESDPSFLNDLANKPIFFWCYHQMLALKQDKGQMIGPGSSQSRSLNYMEENWSKLISPRGILLLVGVKLWHEIWYKF